MGTREKIRVRFAPSPTGYLHIGGLRTYLYNWLFARQNKGEMILRIEDTDRQRYVEGATESLIKTLKRIGLRWDKGPFLQSQRVNGYQTMAQRLIDSGHAYYCFCSPEILEEMKQKQVAENLAPQYDGRCRNLTEEEIRKRLSDKQPYVIRLKVPEQGVVKFNDLIRGKVEFDLENIDDQVLMKSDGWPTYHLANVIDDHAMGITHVIRGEEWLPSTPKHILLYRAFGWPIPEFAHLPLLLNSDHSKLSKRQGDVAVEDYLKQGYLSETLLNFLALLGWNPGNNQEVFNLDQLVKDFSLEKIQKSGAIFNREKLDWLNGHYIRKKSVSRLLKLCLPYLKQAGLDINYRKARKVVSLEQERLKRLDQIGELVKFFFTDKLEYDPKILIWKKMSFGEVTENLKKVRFILEKIPSFMFKTKNISKKLDVLAKEKGVGEIFWPLRACLSGEKASPPPQDIAEIIGRKKTLERINLAINKMKEMR